MQAMPDVAIQIQCHPALTGVHGDDRLLVQWTGDQSVRIDTRDDVADTINSATDVTLLQFERRRPQRATTLWQLRNLAPALNLALSN